MSPPWIRKEQIGSCTLYLGDCREIIPVLDEVGSCVSDPPYGMDYRSGHNSGRKGQGKALARRDGNFAPIEGDREAFDPSLLLGLGVPSVIWGANHFNDRLPPRRRWLVWNKLVGKTPLPSGSDIELAWCSEPGPDWIFDHLWRGIMRAGEENIVHSPKHHPNQKPVALMSWCFQFVPAGRIFDPYMGSGSTGVAAVRAGRPFTGIELDSQYFEIALARIQKAHTQKDLFIEQQPHVAWTQQRLAIGDGGAS